MTASINHPVARPITILGTGHALPAREVLSSELDIKLNHRAGYIEEKSGVRKRHFAEPTETAAALGAKAAVRALSAANLSLSDIDCLVAASATMDQGMPSNAALIHYELGMADSGVPAFDVNASCLGFLVALDTVSWSIAAGRYRRVLIVASDIASCGLDWASIESSAIFGDGAAAAVIGLSEQGTGSKILSADLKTYSSGVDFCKIPAGGSRYHPSRINEPFIPLKHHVHAKNAGQKPIHVTNLRTFHCLPLELVRTHAPDDALQQVAVGRAGVHPVFGRRTHVDEHVHLVVLHLVTGGIKIVAGDEQQVLRRWQLGCYLRQLFDATHNTNLVDVFVITGERERKTEHQHEWHREIPHQRRAITQELHVAGV